MVNHTPKLSPEINCLQAKFAKRLPKEFKWMNQQRDVFTWAGKSCWEGFKAGYVLAKEEAEGARLEAVKDFILSRRDDIEKDLENFGMLKPVLNYFLKEA